MLLLIEFAHDATDRIYKAIVASTEGEKALKPILKPYNTVGSTRYVDFDTTRAIYLTDSAFCHISHVVADTESWEQKMAQALEELGEEGLLISYIKNQSLGFSIPYTINGEQHNYNPDFIARLDDGRGKNEKKAAKVSTARDFWVPAINNHGGFGRWGFIEISDPWDAKDTVRSFSAYSGRR
jgi:type III restriction enzyme